MKCRAYVVGLFGAVLPMFVAGRADAQALQSFDETWDFEDAPNSGWFFGGNAGYDIDKGFAHSGNDNVWINAWEPAIWNSVNVEFNPNQGAIGQGPSPTTTECGWSAWIQTRPNFFNGVVNLWNTNAGKVNSGQLDFLDGWDIEASPSYTQQTGNFIVPTGVIRVLFDFGFWGSGTAQWIRVDDVNVTCWYFEQ
jgi:hypothetical protein